VSERNISLCTCVTVNGDRAVHPPEEPVVPVLYQVSLRSKWFHCLLKYCLRLYLMYTCLTIIGLLLLQNIFADPESLYVSVSMYMFLFLKDLKKILLFFTKT